MSETNQSIQHRRQSRRVQARRRNHGRKETSRVRDAPRHQSRHHLQMADPVELEQPETEELFYVGVRKYGLDENTPWWERWFFRGLYLPFVRLSFKWLHIPAQGTLHSDGSFSWVEHIGIATDRESAEQMCKGEFYVVHALPVNSGLPQESLQYKGHVYPKSVVPDRYRRRTFPLTAEPVKHLAALRDQITNLRKVAGT